MSGGSLLVVGGSGLCGGTLATADDKVDEEEILCAIPFIREFADCDESDIWLYRSFMLIVPSPAAAAAAKCGIYCCCCC